MKTLPHSQASLLRNTNIEVVQAWRGWYFFLHMNSVKSREGVERSHLYVGIPVLRTGKRTKIAGNLLHLPSYSYQGGANIIHTKHWIHSLKKHAKLCLSVLKTGPISIVSLSHENMKTHSWLHGPGYVFTQISKVNHTADRETSLAQFNQKISEGEGERES